MGRCILVSEAFLVTQLKKVCLLSKVNPVQTPLKQPGNALLFLITELATNEILELTWLWAFKSFLKIWCQDRVVRCPSAQISSGVSHHQPQSYGLAKTVSGASAERQKPSGFQEVSHLQQVKTLGNNHSTVSYPRTHTEIVMVRQGSIRESPEDSHVYYVYGTFLNTHRLIKNLVIAGQVFPFTSVFQIFASYTPEYL